jgi:hypothetical protein
MVRESILHELDGLSSGLLDHAHIVLNVDLARNGPAKQENNSYGGKEPHMQPRFYNRAVCPRFLQT